MLWIHSEFREFLRWRSGKVDSLNSKTPVLPICNFAAWEASVRLSGVTWEGTIDALTHVSHMAVAQVGHTYAEHHLINGGHI